VGLNPNPEYGWSMLIATVLLVAFVVAYVVGLWFSKRELKRDWMLSVVPMIVPMITLGEVSQRINEVIKNIVLTVFEVATPVLNTVGIVEIILGLLLWFGARQEFLGWRLLVAGVLTLVFVNIVAPMLLSFI
jgi:uncharacterized membrane protein YiaA